MSQDDLRWYIMICTWMKELHIGRRQAAKAEKMENNCQEVECRKSQLLCYFGESKRSCRASIDELYDVCISAQAVHCAQQQARQRFTEVVCFLLLANNQCPKPSPDLRIVRFKIF